MEKSKLYIYVYVLSFIFYNLSISQEVLKGPYLIFPLEQNSMTVLWQLSAKSQCTIKWGLDPNYSIGESNSNEYSSTTHQHKFTISDLQASKLYYYEISFNKTKLIGSFRAAPDTNSNKVSIFAWGDTRDDQIDPNIITEQINLEISKNIEYQTMIIHAGDWVGTDAETSWSNEFFNRANAESNLKMHSLLPQMGCRGNHEGNAVFYKQYFPYNYAGNGCYYSYDYGPIHISVIDQYVSYSKGSEQYNWLVADLSNSSKKWKIILLHEPGWSAAGGHPNNINVQTTIQPLCEKYNVSMLVAGHNHYYARGVVNNIVHLTLGGGGAASYTPLSNQKNIISSKIGLSYMRFDINNDTLNAYAMNSNGQIIDTYSLINSTSSVENDDSALNVRIIPNSNYGYFDIYSNLDLRNSTFEIYDLKGQLLKSIINKNDIERTSIDISNQSEGFYLLVCKINKYNLSSKILLMK